MSTSAPPPPVPAPVPLLPPSWGKPPRPTPTRAAGRSSSARRPSCDRSRLLPRQGVALDLLVQVRPRHVEHARGLGHVPVVLAQLHQQEGALGGQLELLKGAARL